MTVNDLIVGLLGAEAPAGPRKSAHQLVVAVDLSGQGEEALVG